MWNSNWCVCKQKGVMLPPSIPPSSLLRPGITLFLSLAPLSKSISRWHPELRLACPGMLRGAVHCQGNPSPQSCAGTHCLTFTVSPLSFRPLLHNRDSFTIPLTISLFLHCIVFLSLHFLFLSHPLDPPSSSVFFITTKGHCPPHIAFTLFSVFLPPCVPSIYVSLSSL